MPSIFLSPSNQEFNQYVNGGNEEYYMNLIADAMVPYLRASGIEFERSNPYENTPNIIERSNEYPYNLHLALQSRGTPDGVISPMRGVDLYYFSFSPDGAEHAAYIMSENLKKIYPVPELVNIEENDAILELRLTNAPAVMAELGYNDNIRDALWIENNIDEIGRTLALSVAEFLNVPFVEPYETILPVDGEESESSALI
ncbi:MAG TPA: N-acetylmuramoyl-L-alanine amidase [Bacillota bacterium]|nr:N-acetylmuramoyl-L-alanine amidase [Bacillota bacterium]